MGPNLVNVNMGTGGLCFWSVLETFHNKKKQIYPLWNWQEKIVHTNEEKQGDKHILSFDTLRKD